jgi:methyl-accepting chemotaxis protein
VPITLLVTFSTPAPTTGHRAVSQAGRAVFGPSEALMRRLKLPQKFLIVAVLLVTPFVVVGKSYLDAQNSQANFAIGERAGIIAVDPMTRLLGAVDGARAATAQGRGRAAAVSGVNAAVGSVDTALANDSRIRVATPWAAVKSRIDDATGFSGTRATTAWSSVATDLVSLIATVADQSKLTLDPVLNTYYLQDAVTVKIPALLQQAGLGASLAVSGARAHRDPIAIANGAITATMSGLATDLQKAIRASHGLPLGPASSALGRLSTATAALARTLTQTTTTQTSLTGDPAAAVRRDALTLAAATSPQLDAALQSHIDGFRANERTVEIVAALVLLLAAWLFVGFFRSMTGSVKGLIGALSAVESGDLRTAAQASPDEVGQMAVALNRMRVRIGEMVDRISRTSTTLSSASVQLSAVSTQMTSAAERTADRAGNVSAAAEQVSASVQTVSAGTEEMGASITEIARQAAEAARVATEAVAAAETTNQLVGRLDASSSEIDEVIKFIGSIAKQTNLLALNATIEAARAGEAGKGFAVVASEVKELARDTALSSEKIERNIAGIQSDTREAIRAIGEITSTIHQINDIQSMIASAVEEQAVTTNEIARSVGEAAAGSSAIAGSITGVADAARETKTGAIETHRSAEELAKLAGELLGLTRQFQLAPDAGSAADDVPAATAPALAPAIESWQIDGTDAALAEVLSSNGHR